MSLLTEADADQEIVLYESLEELRADQGTRLDLPDPAGTPCQIVAGASHFLILTTGPDPALYTFSTQDNRFAQLGAPQAALRTVHRVAFFDGLHPVQVAAGVRPDPLYLMRIWPVCLVLM